MGALRSVPLNDCRMRSSKLVPRIAVPDAGGHLRHNPPSDRHRVKTQPPTTDRVRRGFTLAEVLVVLILLGLTAGLTALSLRPPSMPAGNEFDRLVATARSNALRRAEALELRVDAAGQWTLRPAAGRDGADLASGQLGSTSTAVRLRIDALGTCIPSAPAAWDATRCREIAGR